jgi:hypothetical protein
MNFKHFGKLCGAAIAALFLCPVARADSVLVSTFTPTAVVNSGYFGKATTVLYPSAVNVIYLNSQPIVSTTAFVASGFQINVSSTTPLVLPDFHGNIYAIAPSLASPATLYYLTGF